MSKSFEFDDCAICQALKAAEEQGKGLSESELVEAFKKQKESGIGVLGTGADLENM